MEAEICCSFKDRDFVVVVEDAMYSPGYTGSFWEPDEPCEIEVNGGHLLCDGATNFGTYNLDNLQVVLSSQLFDKVVDANWDYILEKLYEEVEKSAVDYQTMRAEALYDELKEEGLI